MTKSFFKLPDFSSSIKIRGVARTNRFEINIFPPSLPNATRFDNRELSVRCHSGALPPMNIITKNYVVGQGQHRMMPVGYDQGHQLTFSFYVDGYRGIYNDLISWAARPFPEGEANSHAMAYYNEFTGVVQINQLDEADVVRHTYFLQEAYPINVEMIELDSGQVDHPQLARVIFAYRYATVTTDTTPLPEVLTTRDKRKGKGLTPRQENPQIDDPSFADVAKTLDRPDPDRKGKLRTVIDKANLECNDIRFSQSTKWPEIAHDSNTAIISNLIPIATAAKTQMVEYYDNLAASVSVYFADVTTSYRQYNELVATDGTDVDIHAMVQDMQSKYNLVGNVQMTITNEYTDLKKELDGIISPSPTITIAV